MTANPSHGLYFLANDAVLNWAIAFFESVRTHDPDLRMVMIPFNSQIDGLVAVRDKYRFELFDDPSLPQLDEIGKRFFPHKEMPRHTFRKFAVFWGPLERFIFSDVDIVTLKSLREFSDAYDRSGLDLLHTDEEIFQVYETPELQARMIKNFGSHGFNTGFWAARRGLLSLERIAVLAEEAMPVAPQFNQGTYEQPFLNFCCDVSRMRYAHMSDFIPDMSRRFLSNQKHIKRDSDGMYRIHDAASKENGKRISLVHWAGTPANAVMPYRSLFLHYRLKSLPAWKRILTYLVGLPRAVIWTTVASIRQTRWLLGAYKRLMPASIQARIARRLYRK